MGGFSTSRSSSVSGIISGWASVTCPAKTWMPWMRTVRYPAFEAVRLHTA